MKKGVSRRKLKAIQNGKNIIIPMYISLNLGNQHCMACLQIPPLPSGRITLNPLAKNCSCPELYRDFKKWGAGVDANKTQPYHNHKELNS